MTEQPNVSVKCPICNKSLMNFEVQVDNLPSIQLEAKILDKLGHIYLSQVYGSYNKEFRNVDDIEGSIAAFSCPSCYSPFPVRGICDCKAPLINLELEIGGTVKICTRTGCKMHSLEFEDFTPCLFVVPEVV
ncbi:MAG: hypothetical protein ABIL06_10305 [Pseudomonadota bacterium]